MTTILSAGGAYLVLSEAELAGWPGATDMAVYDSIPFGADEGLIAQVHGLSAIILGVPDPLSCVPLDDGGIFITAVCCEDEETIPELMEDLAPGVSWKSLGRYTTAGPVVAFDSAQPGASAEGLRLELKPGEYEVAALTFIPDDATELQLLRLRRVS